MTGTVVFTAGPTDVLKVLVTVRPASAGANEPITCLPIRCGSGWDQRMPFGLNVTT